MRIHSQQKSRTRVPGRPRPSLRPGHVIGWLLTAVLLVSLVAVVRAMAASAPPPPAVSAGTIFHAPAMSRAPATASHSKPRQPARTAPPRTLPRPRPAPRTYTVRSGDTLSSIARQVGGPSAGWTWLYQANWSRISDPDLIYPGQVLIIPATRPANRETFRPSAGSSKATDDSPAHKNGHLTAATVAYGHTGGSAPRGTLGCAGLESLWEQAGGSPARAVTAASIAMAESSGAQYATGGAGERGYWQIHPDHGSLSTYDPYGNADAAVIISANGTNWTPWTTYTSGAYLGRC
jgi:LysM repeat protein